jgi:hypothetical protein
MKIRRTFIAIAALATLYMSCPMNARAGALDQKIVFTFNQPVEIPGMVLPAGSYVFRLVEGFDPNVVQIWSADETHLYTTTLTIPDYRPEPGSGTALTFQEGAAGSPKAVKEWFYPGDNSGHEFVYHHNVD